MRAGLARVDGFCDFAAVKIDDDEPIAAFGRDHDFTLARHQEQTMRLRIIGEVDRARDRKILNVEHGQTVAAAVVRADGPAPVTGDDELVRIVARRQRRESFTRGQVDEARVVGRLVEHDQRARQPLRHLRHDRDCEAHAREDRNALSYGSKAVHLIPQGTH